MKKISIGSKGFTLIELLVVITIIGILMTIVIQSLSDSRTKAYDSEVKQQLVRFRSAAEIYFNNQTPNSYSVAGDCVTANTMFTDVDQTDGAPGLYLQFTNLPAPPTIVCGSDGFRYALKATLPSTNAYWCVDSKGASKQVAGAIGTSVLVCP